jgi:hypothetical protein
MKRHLFGTVSALLVVYMVAGCTTDPTQDLRGGVATVLVSRTYVDINVGQVLRMNAKALDAQGNVLPILPTITTSDAAIVSVTIDDTTSGDPLPQTDFQILGVADGSAMIVATAGGVLSDSTDVVVLPAEFEGTVALDATGSVDVLTLSATPLVKFDPDASQVLVNNRSTVLISRTAEEMRVAVPVAATTPLTGAVVTVEDLVFSPPHGTFDIASLDAPTTVDIRTGFAGSVVLDASGAVDLLTISATSDLKFDAAASTVLVDDHATVLLSRTADQLEVAVISAEDLDDATVTVTDLEFTYDADQYEVGDLDSPTVVDIRTTLFDGAITVDASEQADHITLTSSASFEFANDAAVLIDGEPTFAISNSGTQLVVAGANVDAVTGGTVTIENALYLGLYDVASVVAASTVDLEAFDNSFTSPTEAGSPDITAGPYPYVYWTLVNGTVYDQYVMFNSATALPLSVTADWLTGADVDVLWSGDGYACGAACSSHNPEEFDITIPAGVDTYLLVELWTGDPTIVRVTIEQ